MPMLCDPCVYDGRQPILFTQLLPNGETFAIRHFSVDYDLEELQREFIRQTRSFRLHGLIEQFQNSFHFIAGSSTSQAFTVSLDGTHLFEIEVHQATAHPDLLATLAPQTGDFVLQLSAGNFDKTTPGRYASALHATMRYFFTYPEVRRLLLDTRPYLASEIRTILEPAGLTPLPRSKIIYYKT
jgi:hypothetical protein